MRTLWTTGSGPDPALRQVSTGQLPSAVATATVGGAEVIVTLTERHEDFDCHLADLHATRCPRPGMRMRDRATGELIRTDRYPLEADAEQLAVVGDRALAVVILDPGGAPVPVDLETGRRIGGLPGHDDAKWVEHLAAVDTDDGPVVVTAPCPSSTW
ncbi:hypothetical protein [Actinoplanes sp. NBRC 101535]|uniref:hypothetical protein n=1 Tax=Actinoplanes sp. NBRC 101535 TaxID=3032196 RepID=UPI0024A2564A|nr:hypothetical protein [Actinoplanes sp. NBRC 101535]GLY03809.1 hypothetical protein Acsp01_41880 [Actinoplanes sp. NBRC 101535]